MGMAWTLRWWRPAGLAKPPRRWRPVSVWALRPACEQALSIWAAYPQRWGATGRVAPGRSADGGRREGRTGWRGYGGGHRRRRSPASSAWRSLPNCMSGAACRGGVAGASDGCGGRRGGVRGSGSLRQTCPPSGPTRHRLGAGTVSVVTFVLSGRCSARGVHGGPGIAKERWPTFRARSLCLAGLGA